MDKKDNLAPPTGWKKEALTRSDYSYHKIYGAPPFDLGIKPIGRDISGIPVVYQGNKFTCVASTVTWITQYLKKQKEGNVKPLAQDFLAEVSRTEADGATPGQVLDAAKNIGVCESALWADSNEKITKELEENAKQYKIEGYAYLHNLNPKSIYDALMREPIMVGVDSYLGSEPHMMAGYDVENRGGVLGVKTANWWNPSEQDKGFVPFSDIKFAASILLQSQKVTCVCRSSAFCLLIGISYQKQKKR